MKQTKQRRRRTTTTTTSGGGGGGGGGVVRKSKRGKKTITVATTEQEQTELVTDLRPTGNYQQKTASPWLTTWHWPLSPSGNPLHHLPINRKWNVGPDHVITCHNNTKCALIISSPVTWTQNEYWSLHHLSKQRKVCIDHFITWQNTKCVMITSSPVKSTQTVHWSFHYLT